MRPPMTTTSERDLLTILRGDARDTLSQVQDGTVQMCVTSPPYWGLRSYLPKGHPDKAREIGQEKSPDEYVETMVGVFREVKRCLHDSGTLWLNVGDSYAGSGCGSNDYRPEGASLSKNDAKYQGQKPGRGFRAGSNRADGIVSDDSPRNRNGMGPVKDLKPKDLCGIPWRLVLALQADGWYWRSCIVWHKRSCMPESVTDRPTNSWEPIFLLAKSQRYFYDAEAVREDCVTGNGESQGIAKGKRFGGTGQSTTTVSGFGERELRNHPNGRNQRNVWSLSPEPFREAHFATFPTEIPRRAIKAGSKPGDIILDPFGGSGTTGQVAIELGRRAILCELNPEYIPLIERRTTVTVGLPL